MTASPRYTVDEALGLAGTAIRSWADPILAGHFPGGDYLAHVRNTIDPNRAGSMRPPSTHDPVFWLKTLGNTNFWNAIFQHRIDPRAQRLSRRLVERRNDIAHYEPTAESPDWARKALTETIELVALIPDSEAMVEEIRALADRLAPTEPTRVGTGSAIADSHQDECVPQSQPPLEASRSREEREVPGTSGSLGDTPGTPGQNRRVAESPHESHHQADPPRAAPPSLSSILLEMDTTQRSIVERFSVGDPTGWLIGGEPGSGKSLVLLHAIVALFGGDQLRLAGTRSLPSVLFTAYTHSLQVAAESLLDQMLTPEQRRRVTVKTINGLALGQVGRTHGTIRPVFVDDIADAEALHAFSSFRAAHPQTSFHVDDLPYLLDEVDTVIAGRALFDLNQYLEADRTGRGRRFTPDQRKEVHEFYGELVACLRSGRDEPSYLWSEVHALAASVVHPEYDYVFIDEAQDLRPAAIRFAARLCRDRRKVSLAIDRNQTIYGAAVPWSQIHEELDFRGRSRRLVASHRSSREILAAVEQLSPAIDPGESPPAATFQSTRPILAWHGDDRSWADYLNRFIEATTVDEGVGPDSVAILCPTDREIREVSALVDRRFRPKGMKSGSFDASHPGVKVTTIHAAKGLGFPIVVVAGVEDGRLPLDRRNAPEDHYERQQRLLFVACTRAMNRLLVLANRQRKSPLLEAVTADRWDIVEV